MMKYEYTINKVLNPERITDPRVQLKEKKEINIKNLRNRKIKQRYRYDTDGHKTRVVETHERAVFLKSLGRKGKMLEIYESPPLPLLFYRSTAAIDVHTYAVREGANPFTFPTPRFYSIQAFPISRLDNRANNGQGQIIFAPQPLSPTSGWSVDIPDIIVFDGDFRSSAKRLYLLIEQALNRAWPSPLTRRSKRISAMGSRAWRLQFRTVLYIYIYIFACVARLLVSRARYKSRGITCTRCSRGNRDKYKERRD